MRKRYYANFRDTNPMSSTNILIRGRGQTTSSGGNANS